MINVKHLALFMMILGLIGCASADIRPLEMRRNSVKEDAVTKGEALVKSAYTLIDPTNQWHAFDYLNVTTVDSWSNGFLRSLTPLTANKQRVKFTFTIQEPGTRMTFLEGKRQGEEIIDNEGGLKAGLYLPYVRNYFLWPFSLKKMPYKAYIGEDTYGDQKYAKVYLGTNSKKFNPKDNQYIIWINNTTGYVDIIEFTLRELSKSYSGAIYYGNFKDIQGVKIPFQLKLIENVKKPKPSHKFTLEDVLLK